MEITEVRIKLMDHPDDRLQAFCSITFDNSFVVRDLKVIEGASGPFVAMPSRKLTFHCPYCNCKNHLRALHCNQCGRRLEENRAMRDQEGRAKLYADIAHPINAPCREMIQQRVIAEFEAELEDSKQPGYVSRYHDDYGEDFDSYDFDETYDEDEPLGNAPAAEANQAPQRDDAARRPRRENGLSHSIDREHRQAPPPHRVRRKEQDCSSGKVEEADEFGKGIF